MLAPLALKHFADQRKKRVLAIVPNAFCFGLQNVTLSFFSRLKHEVDVRFLLTRWTDGEFSRRLDTEGISYDYSWLGMFSRKIDAHNLNMTLECLSKLPILYRDFGKIVSKYQPDLIYTANHHELILLAPLLKMGTVPVVCHLHDPPPNARFYRNMFQVIDRFVDRFVVISDSVFSRTSSLGVPKKKLTRVYNGIDLRSFPFVPERTDIFRRQFSWPTDSIILGITGQVLERKGHLDVLKALAIAVKSDSRVRLVIGGKRDGPFFHKLCEQVDTNGLSKLVAFSGWQSNAADFFSGLDVFILASRHEEGFGLVLAEAMATGRPVISTSSGGAAEIVVDGQSGLLVNKQSPSELADAILRLSSKPSARNEMARSARTRVETHFNLATQANQLGKVFTETGGLSVNA